MSIDRLARRPLWCTQNIQLGCRAVRRAFRSVVRLCACSLFIAASFHAKAADFTPSAKLHLDYAAHHEDASELDDGGIVRRAKLGLGGKQGDWGFKVDYEFANGGKLKSALVSYAGWRVGDIQFGQIKVPPGLEKQISSDNNMFIERSLPSSAFSAGRRVGVRFDRQAPSYTLSAAAFGSEIDGDDRQGVAARATLSPTLGKGHQRIHLGVTTSIERAGDSVKLDTRPESRPANKKLVATRRLEDVDRITRAGLETAWQRGPVSVQAEFRHTHLRRDSGLPGLDFNGAYVAGSWFITGETRPYRDGSFKSIKVDRPNGAWELAARYSRIDLDDRDVTGGREHNISLGLNWYINNHVRMMFNYIDVRSQRRGVSDNPRIMLIRAQIVL